MTRDGSPQTLRADRGANRTRSRAIRAVSRAALALLVAAAVLPAASCSSTPDKRILQFLNQEGYGRRYAGDVREEVYVTVGDTFVVYDEFDANFSSPATVQLDGTITLPELGTIPVAGMTRSELESYLTQRRAELVFRTSVRVDKLVMSPRTYWVFGEVAVPGRKVLDGDITIFDAVMDARPLDVRANMGRIKLVRPDAVDPLVMYFDARDFLHHGAASRNYEIHEDDIVYVPPTMMVSIGDFMGALVTPIGQVLAGITGPLIALARLDRINDGSYPFFF
ncbi:MAG: polysaccharide biosynthesis/export family protein [Planctomycetota bacterium]